MNWIRWENSDRCFAVINYICEYLKSLSQIRLMHVIAETFMKWRWWCVRSYCSESKERWLIKAGLCNMSFRGQPSSWELSTVLAIIFLNSHRYYSWMQFQGRVIGLWWAVRHNLKALSICNVLKRLPHAMLHQSRSIPGTSLSPQ